MAMKPGNGGGGNGERDPRLDLLYRDTPRATPPPHLDAAILAAARREVGARPRPLSTQLRRWRLPVSIAAVVVLSATLVTLVGEESKDPLMIELRSTVERPVTRTVEPQQIQPGEPVKLAEDRQRAPAAQERFMARRDEAAAGAPMERQKMEQEAASGAGVALGDRRAATVPEADLDMLSPPRRESPRRPGADEPGSQPPSVAARRSAPEAPAPAAAPSQPMPGRVQAEQALAMKRPPVWHGLEQEPPQKWLERLADLRKRGRAAEADELLAELKRRFPDHPLPSGVE